MPSVSATIAPFTPAVDHSMALWAASTLTDRCDGFQRSVADGDEGFGDGTVLDAELKAVDCDTLSWRLTVVVVGCRCDVVLCGLTVDDFTRSACFVANTQHINKYITASITGKHTHTQQSFIILKIFTLKSFPSARAYKRRISLWTERIRTVDYRYASVKIFSAEPYHLVWGWSVDACILMVRYWWVNISNIATTQL